MVSGMALSLHVGWKYSLRISLYIESRFATCPFLRYNSRFAIERLLCPFLRGTKKCILRDMLAGKWPAGACYCF